jgi:hypothetical protein
MLLKSVGTSDWLMDFSMLVAIDYYGMRVIIVIMRRVGKEVEGGLKVNEDELGDLCEHFSCK